MTEGKATASSRRIAWGRYLLVFFVAAWMFVLGVLVGRGTAPVTFDTQALQKELIGLRDAKLAKDRDTLEQAIRGEDEKAPLEFYEKLKKDTPDTSLPAATPVPAAGGAAATAEAPAVAGAPAPPHKARADLMAKSSRRAVKPAATAKPAPAASENRPAAPAGGDLTIQVAALKDPDAAERIVANLKRQGYPAYLSRVVVADEGLWFRVRVGRYRDREQAAADMARLTGAHRRPILVKR